MSQELPSPPKKQFTIHSNIIIWLLPLILPQIRKFTGRLATRVISTVIMSAGAFLTGLGFTGDEFAQYGFDIDMEKVLYGISTVIVAAIVFGMESLISWVSTKLVPPPKAISAEEVVTDTSTYLNPSVSTSVVLTVEPKLKLPQSTEDPSP
jgi:hypothetical protein